jgi:hypothetical protein
MTITTSDEEPLVASDPPAGASARGLVVHFLCVVGVSASAGAFWGGLPTARSAAFGVLLAAVNMLLMRRIMGALTATSGTAALWALVLPLKLVGLVAVAYVLVHFGVAQPVPLACGFALLPLTGVFLPRASSVPSPTMASRRMPRAR